MLGARWPRLRPAVFGYHEVWHTLVTAAVGVHFVAVDDRSTVRLRPWERGAGITEACGSGACAAAHLANDLGLVDEVVRVAMPGGSATVAVGESILLTGPSARGADHRIDPAEVLAGG